MKLDAYQQQLLNKLEDMKLDVGIKEVVLTAIEKEVRIR